MPPWINPFLLGAMALSFSLHFMILHVEFLAVCRKQKMISPFSFLNCTNFYTENAKSWNDVLSSLKKKFWRKKSVLFKSNKMVPDKCIFPLLKILYQLKINPIFLFSSLHRPCSRSLPCPLSSGWRWWSSPCPWYSWTSCSSSWRATTPTVRRASASSGRRSPRLSQCLSHTDTLGICTRWALWTISHPLPRPPQREQSCERKEFRTARNLRLNISYYMQQQRFLFSIKG